MDCSLSRGAKGEVVLLEGQNYTMRKGYPKFYVYELPPNLTSWFNIRRVDRPLHLLFWQRLMSTGLRTTNGYEADYFFIPLNMRHIKAPQHTEWAIPYIQRTWPFWNEVDHGQRHLIIHTGDMGRHELHLTDSRRLMASLDNMTWLTHWGMTKYHNATTWAPSTRPGKDVVVPVMITTHGFEFSPLNPAIEAAAIRKGKPFLRRGTFFFAGRMCGDRKPPNSTTGECQTQGRPDYSAGVRIKTYYHHRNRTGFRVVPFTKRYMKDITSHKFCLAPTGGGHGKRQVLVALMGCIPVTITDGVHQPFEPELDWGSFSVPVLEKDIPVLHDILWGIDNATVASMQHKLRCAAQHMYYSSSVGAIMGEDGRYDAFETIIEILRMRLKYPDVPPERYREVDEHFRQFSDCELGGPTKGVLCGQGHKRTYEDTPTCNECHLKIMHRRTGSHFYAWAGGMICCTELNMMDCPKMWS
ncbi:hypothetical protein HYH03_004256 [Edaphochlamys debaryana]|uniref:Exostosin GT47 domain-containing protein n=1 Tax=Edaphochlamys debaryana TaxID=47281 RepID=A0A836C3P9_9CHLO|nr:hypothetical protein HYH03_004256 [Edaphochlamys debaryana]|eukprot:KAG2497997.1 hypothetical protein HYH03_004256 [Edaphochlamys debaryana]